MTIEETATSEVIASVEGHIGRLRLNRPKALHALTTAMCETMLAALDAWATSPAVELVMIDHALSADGDPRLSRGFCAGGDIRLLADSGAGEGSAARAFFHAEYRLNHRLFTYAKPTIALMDGITMGGGVGIALPCRYRIATENTKLAMPETAIGLFPDVGGGWYLSRLPGRIGQYLALTGARLNGAECTAFGLATHYLSSAVLDEAKARISAQPLRVEAILDELSATPPEAPIMARLPLIDRCFAPDDLAAVLERLDAEEDPWAAQTAETIRAKSPTACAISLRMLVESQRHAHFVDEMQMEYGLMVRTIAFPDFPEGVRALLIDKDNTPRWAPLADVAPFFEPLPPRKAWSPL